MGQTNNLNQRIRDHKNKTARASKFSKENGEFKLVFQEIYSTLFQAMRREKQLKGWTRVKKEALIEGNLELLKNSNNAHQYRLSSILSMSRSFLLSMIFTAKQELVHIKLY